MDFSSLHTPFWIGVLAVFAVVAPVLAFIIDAWELRDRVRRLLTGAQHNLAFEVRPPIRGAEAPVPRRLGLPLMISSVIGGGLTALTVAELVKEHGSSVADAANSSADLGVDVHSTAVDLIDSLHDHLPNSPTDSDGAFLDHIQDVSDWLP